MSRTLDKESMIYLPERAWDLNGPGMGSGYYFVYADDRGNWFGLRIFSPGTRPPQLCQFKDSEGRLEVIRSFNRSSACEVLASNFRIIVFPNGDIRVRFVGEIAQERKENDG